MLPASKSPSQFSSSSECWFDDACILDMDYFVKTLAAIKSKGVRPDLIGSIITHYASKWLPDLSDPNDVVSQTKTLTQFHDSPTSPPPESVTAIWMKKRFFVETLIGVLPPEKDAIPCNFLLRLLRTANMVGVEANYRSELEKRISWQLDEASLKEVMIPSFCHTCETLLDVELVIRLVKRFVSMYGEIVGGGGGGGKSGAAMVKVAKLVDSYLAEAAVDANLSLPEFVTLAAAMPSHSRATDDGLYRAIDTYLKAHPVVTKQERKGLCRLIDCRKLSPEASMHASQNERLPVRAVIQVLLSEQTKLNRHIDWSGSFSFSETRSSPINKSNNMIINNNSNNGSGGPLDLAIRSLSKREMHVQQMEIKKLKEDVYRLQKQLSTMQAQMERMIMEKSNNKKGLMFKWKRFGMFGKSSKEVEGISINNDNGELRGEDGFIGRETPMDLMKTRLVKPRTPHKQCRKSLS